MKRFQFTLESALKVRKLEAEIEEAKLLRLERERAECRRAMDQLAMAARSRPASLSNGEPVTRAELEDLDRMALYVKREKQRLIALEGALLHKIATAKGQLRQAAQRVELLKRLKGKAHEGWRKEAEKELQTLAEESFNHQFQTREE